MNAMPGCPKCNSSNIYEYSGLYTCPDCGHEWPAGQDAAPIDEGGIFIVRDANGVELKDGDTVMVIKDLKVKGSSSPLKSGTKVKNIRLVDSDHNIDCTIPGIGAMGLKSEFVKKITG
ncbi:MAG: phnA [Rickettsiaceae bacterium]|jgi:protein PhnA|nr:phnA [Rickettsiaceae bacterium]